MRHRSRSLNYFKSAVILALMATTLGRVPAMAAVGAGTTGVGFVLGDPLGPRFKTWLNHTQAIDAGIGLADDVALYGDFTWNGWDIFPKPERGRFVGYLGFGPRFEIRQHRSDTFGIRLPAGVSYFVQGAPVEIYFELVPVVRLAPDVESDVDAGLGINYYFTPF